MLRTGKTLAAMALVAALGGCEAGVRKDAAKGAERLLAAVVARDRVAFEAAVDRRAVRDDLRGQLLEVARAQGLEVDGGPSEFALDRMIGPEAFRLVDARGERLAVAPSAEQLAAMIEVQDRRRVCVQDTAERCLLTFARQASDEGDAWKLVGMVASDLVIRVPETDTPGETARRAQGRSPEG